jgi:protein-arginine kinase activator protein McsA
MNIKCDVCKNKKLKYNEIENQNHILDMLFLCNECQDKINKLNPDIQQRFKKITNDIIELQLSKNR